MGEKPTHIEVLIFFNQLFEGDLTRFHGQTHGKPRVFHSCSVFSFQLGKENTDTKRGMYLAPMDMVIFGYETLGH